MSFLNKSYILVVATVLMMSTSCEKFVDGVSNVDPTLPRDASLGQVVTSAEVGLMGFASGDLARLAGLFTRQFTGVDRQYVSLNNYNTTSGDYDTPWGNIYSVTLKSLRIARSKAEAVNNLRTVALTQILEAYLMGTSAALWGDIPLSEAVDIENFPNPTYDTQASVYESVLNLLDAAIANIPLSPAGTNYQGDVFGGTDAAWIARANTLKARFYLHLKKYPEAIDAASKGISLPSDDMLVPFGASYLQNLNIYYSFLTIDRPGYMSADFALAPHLLDPGEVDGSMYRGNAKTNETARFFWYYYPEELNSKVKEYDINVRWSGDEDWESTPGEDGFFAGTGELPLLTFAENQLILSEALIRQDQPAEAIEALNMWRAVLNTGYRISPDYQLKGLMYEAYDLTDFTPDTGIENLDGIAVNDAIYREIVEEKYISMIGTLEVFNDMRRFGYGSFATDQNWKVVGIVPNTGSEIPQRFLIPQTEINANSSTPTPPSLFEKTALFQ